VRIGPVDPLGIGQPDQVEGLKDTGTPRGRVAFPQQGSRFQRL